MGKVWPIGPNDEPVGWERIETEPEYEEAVYRDDDPPPARPVITDWKAWRRAKALTSWCLLGSFVLYVMVIRWETWFLFIGCCIAWSCVFWKIRELRHLEKLAEIDHHLARVQHSRMGSVRYRR